MGKIIKPTSASVLVTENCNLRCKYCFEKHNNSIMSNEVGLKTVEWLAQNAIDNGDKEFTIMFFGGEPLLNVDLIISMMERAINISKQYNIKFNASMVTNATVMNEKVYNMIKEYKDKTNLNIQLSVDGLPEIHDEYRVTASGKGSFYLVKKNIPIFQELYGNNPNDKRLSIHGCINKKTLPHLYESYKFFRKELNFKQIWFIPVMEENWDENDIKIYKQENEKIFLDCIEEISQSKDIEDSYNYAPISKWCNLDRGRSSKPCGAGYNFVTITANGEVYPCHQIYFNDPHKDSCIGTIYDEALDYDRQRMFLEYDESFLNCNGCENTQCYRCLAANWVNNGSAFTAIHKNYCGFASVERYYQLKMKQKVDELGLNKTIKYKNTDCLCNVRDGNSVLFDQDNCQSGNNPENPNCLCDVDMSFNRQKISSNDNWKQQMEEKIDLIAAKLDMIIAAINTSREEIRNGSRSKHYSQKNGKRETTGCCNNKKCESDGSKEES